MGSNAGIDGDDAEAKSEPALAQCYFGLLRDATITHRRGGFTCEGGPTRLPRGSHPTAHPLLFPNILNLSLYYGVFPHPRRLAPSHVSFGSDAIPIQPSQTIQYHSSNNTLEVQLIVSETILRIPFLQSERHQDLNGDVVEKVGTENKNGYCGEEPIPLGKWGIE